MNAKASPGAPTPRPSRSWIVLGLILATTAIAAVVGAVAINAEAQRPIGEGELFLMDGQRVADTLKGRDIETDDLRRLRNDLTVEAVSLVGSDGVIVASTAAALEGTAPSSPLMAGFANGGRFGAIAVPATEPITVDGVVEWEPGDIVYEVIQPLDNGQAALLTYDISELLARRSAAGGVPILSLQLTGVAVFLLLGSILLFVARGRAARTYREFALQAEYLQRESEVLTAHNQELDAARRRAEHAYELAEEKNRIRSEFVLMINHELRTPLTGVVTGAELLRSEGAVSDGVWLEILDNVLADGRRLSEMIDQILAVARIENGALFFELHETTMDEIVDRLRRSRPRFEVESEPDSNQLSLQTDPTSVVNLIQSLADNAYTHGADRVTVRTARQLPFDPMLEVGERPTDAVYFLVEDDGPGIDEEFLPRAFEKFEKQSRSSGTGLGLYIARMITDAIDGSLLVSTSSAGTILAIALPAARTRVAAT